MSLHGRTHITKDICVDQMRNRMHLRHLQKVNEIKTNNKLNPLLY